MPHFAVWETEARAMIDEAACAVAAEAGGARDALTRWGFQLLAEFVRLAEEELAPGSEKKAAVLRWAAEFYDRVVAPLNLPGPDAVLDPIVKSAWLAACDLAIDGLVALLKSTTLDRV